MCSENTTFRRARSKLRRSRSRQRRNRKKRQSFNEVIGNAAFRPCHWIRSVSPSFTDNCGPHKSVWNWGDGTTSAGAVTEANGSGSVTGNHAYTNAGVYTVTLTVSDQAGNSAQSVFQFVVVYDPDGGFVTGGGWINSPAGAYPLDPSLVGKATFGFVSKYLHGATVPTGNTE